MTNPLPDWYLRQLEERDPTPARYTMLSPETQRVIDDEQASLWEVGRALKREAERSIPRTGGVTRVPVKPELEVTGMPVEPEQLPKPFWLRLELVWLRIRLRWRLRGIGDGFHLLVEVPTA